MVKGKILIVDRIEMKVFLLRGRTKSASMLDLFLSFFFLRFVSFFSFLAALGLHYEPGLSLVQPVRATLHYDAQSSHCSSFSCRGAQTLGAWAAVGSCST